MVAILILALALGGIAFAIARSRILDALFPDRAPTKAAAALVSAVVESEARGGYVLTVNEVLLDGEYIYVDWTLASESGEARLVDPTFRMTRNGEQLDGAVQFPSLGDFYVIGDEAAGLEIGRNLNVLSTIRLMRPAISGRIDVEMSVNILEPLAPLIDDRCPDQGSPAYFVGISRFGGPRGIDAGSAALATPRNSAIMRRVFDQSEAGFAEKGHSIFFEVLEVHGYARHQEEIRKALSLDAGALGAIELPLTGQTSYACDGYTIEFSRLIAGPTATTLGYCIYFDDLRAMIAPANPAAGDVERYVYNLEPYRLHFAVRPDGGAPLERESENIHMSGPSFPLGISTPYLADILDTSRDALTVELYLAPCEPLPKTLVLDAYLSDVSPLDWAWPSEENAQNGANEDPLFSITLACG